MFFAGFLANVDSSILNIDIGNGYKIKTLSQNEGENFIFLELLSKFGSDDVYFYRTTKQTEIDFIVESWKIAIEVKYKRYKEKKKAH